ncbi:CapA family protein [Mesonia sp. MT50]|uniref:CapA family protein n=1 Tax=Mesonia profundi TaxID=3070998 RepID=A0ABU1A4S2_9FLAO|nr:CapA family protein [Mesonia profundi]MDQ7918276.1 CapA family protein [Mesonia profundi]
MLRIVGDINLSDGFFDTGFGIGSELKKGKDPFQNLNRDVEDLWFGNMECVISDLSNKSSIYSKQFRISPSNVKHIHHLDIYNIANNHVMQHGAEAYKDMIANLDSLSVKSVGSNKNKSITISHQSKSIGILSFSQRDEKFSDNPSYWYDPEYKQIEEEFLSIKDNDFKIAYIHWGNEFINKPYGDQKKFGHWLIDLGFDLIIGLHPHVLQGFEVYKNKYIFYSLGNFVFNMPATATKYSCIVNVDLSSEKPKIDYDYIVKGEDYWPQIISENKVPEQFSFPFLNSLTSHEVENEVYYQSVFNEISKYRKSNYKYIFNSIFKYRKKDLLEILMDFGKRRISKK